MTTLSLHSTNILLNDLCLNLNEVFTLVELREAAEDDNPKRERHISLLGSAGQ